jgi:hypothetical protein
MSRRGADLVLHHNQRAIPALPADERFATKAIAGSVAARTTATATLRL